VLKCLLWAIWIASSHGSCRIRDEGYVNGGPGKNGIPSIDEPAFISADIADLSDSTRVIGININGTAKAYPIYILRWHEIVNDMFGEYNIIITYSVLAGSSAAYYSTDSYGTFGTSGYLYENDLVMYDRKTDARWVQLIGRKTKSCDWLERIPVVNTKWKTWKEEHPHTSLLSARTGHDRDYSSNPYPEYSSNNEIYFITSYRTNARPYNLHSPKSIVFILSFPGYGNGGENVELQSYLFPLSTIRTARTYNFRPQIVNRTAVGTFISDSDITAPLLMEKLGLNVSDWVTTATYYSIVVGYDEIREISAAFLVLSNQTFTNGHRTGNFEIHPMNGMSFACAMDPPLQWNITKNFVEEVRRIVDSDSHCGSGFSRIEIHRLPLYESYWFSATAIYPTSIVLSESKGSFFFETYNPEIIYQQPWRPWMIVVIATFACLTLILLSCLGHFLTDMICNQRTMKVFPLNRYSMDEVRLLVEAGLITSEQIKG